MYAQPEEVGGDEGLVRRVGEIARPLADGGDLGPLLDHIGDARYVLIGEASHGTSEFYTWRAQLSKRLISEKRFSFVAVEGDWPDCYQVNRYVKGYPQAGERAGQVLNAFTRWPTWMWANWEIVAFAEWLRKENATLSRKVGFYGLDVYSLWDSMAAVLQYLEPRDPEAAKLARAAFRCFEPYDGSEEAYAFSTRMVSTTCEDEVVALLRELRGKAPGYEGDDETAFSAEQNAAVLVDAERYYRTMVRSDAQSWNVRDDHMVDTLDRLMEFHGPQAKAIVWAHNTHVGDARATDMALAGMRNIGQLVRERHRGDGVVLVGFAANRGSVIAGEAWGADMARMNVPPGRGGSWENILHRAGDIDKLLLLHEVEGEEEFHRTRGHRAIGVVYHPTREMYGNYVPTVLPQRYDALLYLDQTMALHPLHADSGGREMPELYPFGL